MVHHRLLPLPIIISGVLVLLGALLLAQGVMGVSLSITQNGVTHSFVTIDFWDTNIGFTDISASISTAKIVGTQVSPDQSSSFWISAYGWDNQSKHVEFMQIGFLDYNINGVEQGPYTFWATLGGIDNTNERAQNITKIAVGSVHSYDIAFDGNGWSLRVDNRQIQYIPFAFPAIIVGADEETQCPNQNAGNINAGQVTFSNCYVTNAGTRYAFLNVPKPYSILPIITIDTGNNGINFISPSTFQFGWGLNQNVKTDPYQTTTPPTSPPSPTPSPPPIYYLPHNGPARSMNPNFIALGGSLIIIGLFVPVIAKALGRRW